jgi:hypothetical protein
MRVFDIYEHPSNGLRAIKRGFSWPAFLAPSVWSAAKGLGSTTLLLVICSTLMFDVLKLASGIVPDPSSMLILFVATYVLFGLKPGTRGNSWHAESLEREGFERKYVIAARSRSQAMRALQRGQVSTGPDLMMAAGATI